MPLGKSSVSKNDAGELQVRMHESVREHDVYIINTSCVTYDQDGNPVSPNTSLMELLIMINACKTASARRVTAVIPHFFYARQDKKDKSRAPISARLIANMLETAGCDHVIVRGGHSPDRPWTCMRRRSRAFSTCPWTICTQSRLRCSTCGRCSMSTASSLCRPMPVVRSGTSTRSTDASATAIADQLGVDFALFHKERKKANEVSRMVLVGDARGKIAVLVDDMADTCGTLDLAAQRLKESGADRVLAIVTHGILSKPALERISKSSLEMLVVTNTLPQTANKEKCRKIEEIDISHLLAETIRRSHYGESVSVLFSQIPYDTIQPYRHGADTPSASPPRSSTASPVGASLTAPAASILPTDKDLSQHAVMAPSPLRHEALRQE